MSAYSTDDIDIDFEQEGVGRTRKWEQHWGFVLKGSGTIRYTDGSEETISEGQAYYMKPGHIPKVGEEGPLELLEFTPADQSPEQKPEGV